MTFDAEFAEGPNRDQRAPFPYGVFPLRRRAPNAGAEMSFRFGGCANL